MRESTYMVANKIGKHTVKFNNKPEILGTGSVVGVKKEKGPLGKRFDVVLEDDTFNEKTWEKAEIKMLANLFFFL